MEEILARGTALARELLVGANDGVADGALRLALECANYVSAPGGQALGDAAVLIHCVSKPNSRKCDSVIYTRKR